jgi:hypothetical protein
MIKKKKLNLSKQRSKKHASVWKQLAFVLGRAYIPCLEVVDENFKDPTG